MVIFQRAMTRRYEEVHEKCAILLWISRRCSFSTIPCRASRQGIEIVLQRSILFLEPLVEMVRFSRPHFFDFLQRWVLMHNFPIQFPPTIFRNVIVFNILPATGLRQRIVPPMPPLLEVKINASSITLPFYVFYPFILHRTPIFTAFTTYNYPINILQVQLVGPL